ncbi:TIGR02678 family protein [Actinomadura sp. HBU206391]|uniref:TIGR02678 family protein n=1 Tax=Actinomadura sp. HBU206391 TaxID=2731692 RepID=UPI00165030C7|nr:TIGR02678 family protein [Actinomadura sp. HBU206391]MBC6460193.1 TIGR02678 family protein [Actinomadura sp. HBU206391]
MSTLANQLVRAEKEELARAIRLLLAQPLISLHADPDDFDLIRRRHQPLVQWFDYYCGWRLVVEPRLGYARLLKVRADADPSRPARRRRTTRAPFDRRRYTLLCLVAAELLATPVTTIGMLSQRVIQAAAADEHIPAFDPVRAEERAAFVDALKLLEHYGAVTTVDGATDAYLDSEEAKVLYRVDATRVTRLLAAPIPPSQLAAALDDSADRPDLAALAVERRYGSAARLGDEEGPDDLLGEVSETQRNLWARHSLIRRLLDDPVVYREEMTAVQVAYAASLTGRQIIRRAAEEAGFVLEERAEGYLLVDPDAIATDTRFPGDGSHAKVAALLLLDLLTAATGPLPAADVEAEAAGLLERFPRWAKAYQSDGGARRLADDAVEILCSFGLARRVTATPGSTPLIRALPAAYRYTVNRGALDEQEEGVQP